MNSPFVFSVDEKLCLSFTGKFKLTYSELFFSAKKHTGNFFTSHGFPMGGSLLVSDSTHNK